MSVTVEHLKEIASSIEAAAENDPDHTGNSLAAAYRRADAIEKLAYAWRDVDPEDRDLVKTAIVRTREADAGRPAARFPSGA